MSKQESHQIFVYFKSATENMRHAYDKKTCN